MSTISLCALLTCFNRRDTTLACLISLARSAQFAGVDLHAVLTDDGSWDGTAEAVKSRFPWVEVLPGDGSLYWCRGMHRAHAYAVKRKPSHLLWLNDDTLLRPVALAQLLAVETSLRPHTKSPIIVVGSTCDTARGNAIYGGRRRPFTWRPTRFELVAPTSEPQRIDTFDGNIVLVSASAAAAVGNLDAGFEHAMGDSDYGLRAAGAGVGLWLAPGFQGQGHLNPVAGTFADASLPLTQRWRLVQDRKGLPWRSWWRFTRRHAGPAWLLYFAWPYVRIVAQSLVRSG